MQWLSDVLGGVFEFLSSPIDFLLGFLIEGAMTGIEWMLGGIVKLTTLSSGFYDITAVKDMFYLINYFIFMMAGAIATFNVFNQIFKHVVGDDAKTPQQVMGDTLKFGFRLLSMPFFFFTVVKLNEVFIAAIVKYGVNIQAVKDSFGIGKGADGFTGKVATMFGIIQNSVIIIAVVAVMMLIIFLALGFQFMKRNGELFYLYILMPLVSLSALTSDLDMYSTWWRQMLSVVGTQSLQIVGLYTFIQCLLTGHAMFGISILMATISTPALLKEFAYNSGAMNGINNVVRTGMMAAGVF